MADTVWAALIDRHREWHSPGPPPVRTIEEWARDGLCGLSRQRRLAFTCGRHE